MREKIDVVVLAKDSERSLESCCKAVLNYVPVGNLIVVVGKSVDRTFEIAARFANILVKDEGKGIGCARGEGLEHVKTRFYASIDSDVIVCPEWYYWCFKTMVENPLVGACEGYIKPFGRYYYKFQHTLRDKGYCSLGNTLLRSNLIREVGMPIEPYGEDWRLRERIERNGHEWIVNFDLVSTHLVTDIDIFRHYINFGKKGKSSLVTLSKEVVLSLKEFLASENPGISCRAYILLLRLSHFYGLVSGKGINRAY